MRTCAITSTTPGTGTLLPFAAGTDSRIRTSGPRPQDRARRRTPSACRGRRHVMPTWSKGRACDMESSNSAFQSAQLFDLIAIVNA
jgi:hypothetical protein